MLKAPKLAELFIGLIRMIWVEVPAKIFTFPGILTSFPVNTSKFMNTERSPKPMVKIQPRAPSQLKKRKTCKTKHKSLPCKNCQGCLRDNCGKCVSCRDMPKFGGRGVAKQKCIYRKCVNPIMSNCEICRKWKDYKLKTKGLENLFVDLSFNLLIRILICWFNF